MLYEQKETAKGITTTYGYDKNDNIEQVSSTNAGASTLDSMSFTYNNRDLVETVQMGSNAASSGFIYDGNGNIRTYTNRFGHVHTYEYDGYDRMRVTGCGP
jgi:YD repeat-containing protein